MIEFEYAGSELAELMGLDTDTLYRKALGLIAFTKPQIELLEDLFFMESGELLKKTSDARS